MADPHTLSNGFTRDGDGINSDANASRIRAWRSGNQGFSTGVAAKVAFNSETYDNQGEWDNATNYRFTAKSAGYYLVTSTVQWSGASDGIYDLEIRRNGTRIHLNRLIQGSQNEACSHNIIDIVYLTASQYVEIWGTQYSGASGVNGGEDLSFVAIHKLS